MNYRVLFLVFDVSNIRLPSQGHYKPLLKKKKYIYIYIYIIIIIISYVNITIFYIIFITIFYVTSCSLVGNENKIMDIDEFVFSSLTTHQMTNCNKNCIKYYGTNITRSLYKVFIRLLFI